MKSQIVKAFLGCFLLLGIQTSASASVLYSDTFTEGGTLDTNHWTVKANYSPGLADGYATLGNGPFLGISGGSYTPGNNSQGSFIHGKDGWDPSETTKVSLTLNPPVMTTQSSTGDYFVISWFWISDGNPTNAYPILSTNNNFLIKIFQSNGDNQNYDLVQVYRKTTEETYEGTLLWQGRLPIGDDDPYPSLTMDIEINATNYAVTFDQTMTNTSGSLTGLHGMTFTDSLYANLGTSNHNVGRGEGRFTNFSITAIPEPSVAGLLTVGAVAFFSVQIFRRRLRRGV